MPAKRCPLDKMPLPLKIKTHFITPRKWTLSKSVTGMHPTLIVSVCLLLSQISPSAGTQTSLSMPDSSALLANLWKEERQAVVKPEDPRTLYPRERHCQAPEVQEPQEAFQHDDTTWSSLFSRYTLDAGDELDTWLVNQEKHKDTKHEKHVENPLDVLIPLLFPIVFGIFLCFCVAVIPILGAVGFRVLEAIWDLITHRHIKRTGRRTMIMFEKYQRNRNQMLLPDGVKKPPKRLFHLPVFFRLYSGEDVPSELEQSEDDDVWLTKGLHSDDEDDENQGRNAFKLGASLSGLQLNEEEPEWEGEAQENINEVEMN